MARRTRSRIPGKDDEKRKLLTSLDPADFPALVGDILYFSKGHRQVKVMDGPGDGCRDIQSVDKDKSAVITQCKCFADPEKLVGSSDANELIVALTKFGHARGILATTGRFSPQLKREFTDNFPTLHLDWMDGADIVDEVFSNPVLFRAWVSGTSIGRETVFVKIPFVVRRALDDVRIELKDTALADGVTIESGCATKLDSFERFRPPEAIEWSESFGPSLFCNALLSSSSPDLHALESLHVLAADKLFSGTKEVLIVRFGSPYVVPTKNPDFEKGFQIPGYVPRSYIVRPMKPAMDERDYIVLSLPSWIWPHYLSVAEGDWGNWQALDNQRWCHIEVQGPAFPTSQQSRICRMLGDSKRRELRDAQAVFITATEDVCTHVLQNCTVEPDVQCANGPGGGLLGWTFQEKEGRDERRAAVLQFLQSEASIEMLSIEDAIHVTSRSGNPLVPSPAGETYYPAELVWEYDSLPSPHYLKGRACAFIEFWKLPCDVKTARSTLSSMSFELPDGWTLFMDCKSGPKTKQTFPMFSVSVPCPLESSTNEIVNDVARRVDEVFMALGAELRAAWPEAYRATSEFWEAEVRFPAGVYVSTDHGFVRRDWELEEDEEGDD